MNEQATRAGILTGLGELIEGANSGDELVLQYSGHGTQVKDDSGDEADLFDEALVPIDYQQGQLLLDDDLDIALRKLPSGAYLSLFMDCCHSGTNVRAAPARKRQDGAVNRFLKLDSASLTRFQAIGRARNARADAGPAPRVISFAACLDREVALERNGQGDFTRYALELLARSHAQSDSNQAFLRSVLKAFGESREQTPMIAPTTSALKARHLLGGQ